MPARFRNASSAAPGWPSDGWWRTFGSAELDRLVRTAQASNLDAAAAQARLEQADARIKVATQPLIPSRRHLGCGPELPWRLDCRVRPLPHPGHRIEHELRARFLGQEPVPPPLRRGWSRRQRLRPLDHRHHHDASVANTYFQAVALKQQISIARDNLASAQRILEAVQARVRFGTASNLDEAQQESLVDNVRAAIPGLRSSWSRPSMRLAVLLGQTPGSLRLATTNLNALRVPASGPGCRPG